MKAKNENAMAYWTPGYIIYIFFSIVCLIFTMKQIRKAVSESRQTSEALAAETSPELPPPQIHSDRRTP